MKTDGSMVSSVEILRLEKSEAMDRLIYYRKHGNLEMIDAYTTYIGWLYKETQKFGVAEVKAVAKT